MRSGRGEDKQWQKANVSHREGLAEDEVYFVFNSFFSFPNTLYWFVDIKASDFSASLRFWWGFCKGLSWNCQQNFTFTKTRTLQREPLTHRTEHHVLGGLKWQEVPKPISWHIIYKPSHFLFTFRSTSQVSAELAKQMLQNLHVLLLPQKCHPFCSHWSLWFSGKRRERHKPNKLLSTQGLSPRAQPFCATWLHIVFTWGLWKHQWF